ncbi:MAG: hypothetical protein LBR27_04005 [Bifidobacteriaceae bacterium]|jgi:hypothetical protein|nr:hypothetical protein [Bifidobacteriaceae bacterium]
MAAVAAAHTVELLYAQAREGHWDAVLEAWQGNQELGQECAHYVKPSSGWTFLHQAAYFGHETACRELIRLGAAVTAPALDHQTAADVARLRGFAGLAELLACAGDLGETKLWLPPADATTLPSSSRFREASPRTATREMWVSYGGGVVAIQPGETYYVDAFERTLVGWHGSYNPPRGMDAQSMINI